MLPRLEHLRSLVCAAMLCACDTTHAVAEPTCDPRIALGISRIVELDASGGPIYGTVTSFVAEHSFLRHKEVLLTFDDGPSPTTTSSILDTLARFCTKATFFEVGRMALAHPRIVKRVLAEGHTVGTHTWSHPMSLPRMKLEDAKADIERGFTAVTLAAGRPIAPFFRFPGLRADTPLLTYLQHRKVATFTVDIVSNDSFITSVDRLVSMTLSRLDAHGGGIVLFHDIKHQTAKALPIVLTELKRRGYTVVHLRSRYSFEPDLSYARELDAKLAKVQSRGDILLEAADTGVLEAAGGPRVTHVVPEARPVVRATTGRAMPVKATSGSSPIAPKINATAHRTLEPKQPIVRAPARWQASKPTSLPPFRTEVEAPLRGRALE